ncbi:MAG TPA: cytochrome b/b6 domain-containing protein [Syntrophales bacterium]|nr:cytochrome b/b6 domain-containing protein [Syntrophales bacterium]
MKRVYLHPLPLRIWHWLNALIVIFLLATGIQFRMPGIAALWSHNPLLAWHKWAGLAMTASWIFWVIYGLATRHFVRHYTFRRRDFERMVEQARFYLFLIFRGEKNPFHPSPEEKLNALQKLAYGSVMGIVTPVMVATGLIYTSGFRIGGTLLPFDTIKTIDALHVAGFYLFALFLMVHVYMATLSPTLFTHIKGMIVGYEEHPEEEPGEAVPEAAATSEAKNTNQ